MSRLLLVRHAESENNASNARIRREFADDPERMQLESERARKPDPKLSETGLAQAERLADALAARIRGTETLLVSSPMRRALQTARPLAERAGFTLERFVCAAELYEVGGSHYCGQAVATSTAAQIEAEFPVRCVDMPPAGWYAGRTGPESSDEARARVDRLIAWAEQTLADPRFETIVMIAHGDLLSRWLRRWLRVPWQRGLAFMHGNTGVTTLSWSRDDGLLLEGFNDLGHLPAALRTGHDVEAWWRYAWPDLEFERYEGWAAIPEALAGVLAQLREHLFEPEGKRLADYRESDARSVHFVARAAGELAGYVQYDPELGRLRQLIVDPRFRRRELGRRLVGLVEAELRRRGSEQLLVHAWADAINYYRALGFTGIGPIATGPGPAWQAMVKPVAP